MTDETQGAIRLLITQAALVAIRAGLVQL